MVGTERAFTARRPWWNSVPALIAVAALCGLVALLVPERPAGAQPVLLQSTPADGATLAALPTRMSFRFNVALVRFGFGLTRDGVAVDTATPRRGDQPQEAVVDLPAAGPGRYKASWEAHGDDGELSTGSVSFTVTGSTSTSAASTSTTSAASTTSTSAASTSTPSAPSTTGAAADAAASSTTAAAVTTSPAAEAGSVTSTTGQADGAATRPPTAAAPSTVPDTSTSRPTTRPTTTRPTTTRPTTTRPTTRPTTTRPTTTIAAVAGRPPAAPPATRRPVDTANLPPRGAAAESASADPGTYPRTPPARGTSTGTAASPASATTTAPRATGTSPSATEPATAPVRAADAPKPLDVPTATPLSIPLRTVPTSSTTPAATAASAAPAASAATVTTAATATEAGSGTAPATPSATSVTARLDGPATTGPARVLGLRAPRLLLAAGGIAALLAAAAVLLRRKNPALRRTIALLPASIGLLVAVLAVIGIAAQHGASPRDGGLFAVKLAGGLLLTAAMVLRWLAARRAPAHGLATRRVTVAAGPERRLLLHELAFAAAALAVAALLMAR